MQNLPAGAARRITLLTDCMSPVTGFEAQQASFLADMRSAGATLATHLDVIAQLQAAAAR